MKKTPAQYCVLVGDDEMAQVCRDLPESACREQPYNYARQIVALSFARVGEGLADAKLVLAWLLGAIGARAFATRRVAELSSR